MAIWPPMMLSRGSSSGPNSCAVTKADGEGPDHALLARQRHDEEAAQLVRGARERAQVGVGRRVVHFEAVALPDRPSRQFVGGR